MYIIRNKIRGICSKIRVGMEGVHIPWVESYGIWTPGSIFNGGPYSISHQPQNETKTRQLSGADPEEVV